MKDKKIVLFEDDIKHHFYPLSLNRPVFDLRAGIFTLYEKIEKLYPDSEIKIICRPEIEELVIDSGRTIFEDSDFKKAEEYIFINSRSSFNSRHRFDMDTCLIENDELLYLHPAKGRCSEWKKIDFLDGECVEKAKNLGLEEKKIEHKLYHYLWEMVDNCGNEIIKDLKLIGDDGTNNSEQNKGQIIKGEYPVVLFDGAVIDPGAVIDTTAGPVILDQNSRIRPLSFVEGPVYIGKDSLIDGAKIRGNVSVGNVCKIGGEVETSIILDYSNKHHDGFLGHAYVGSWVNLGALSTNSDLRNDYGEISVSMEGRLTRTGSIKVGSLIGDHAKIGIGVMLNTGTVIGLGANLFNQGDIIRKEVPCFVIGSKKPYREYMINRFLDSVITVMNRRKCKLAEAMRKRLIMIYADTKDFRTRFLT